MKNKSVLQFILSLAVFIGGIVLLALKIPGWSLFLGLPATQIGLVFLIFTFERLGKGGADSGTKDYHLIDCLLCHKQTLTPKIQEKIICSSCQVRIAQKLKVGIVTVYVLAIIPLTVALVSHNQEMRRKAAEPSPTPIPTPTMTPTPTPVFYESF